jgi:predicted transposase YdaD
MMFDIKDIARKNVNIEVILSDIFTEFPEFFFDLIEKPQVNSSLYNFLAQETKEQDFCLDGIFYPHQDYPHEILYFVEFQCYQYEEFYDKIFPKIFLYFQQYNPPNQDWRAIVIYDKRSRETKCPPRYLGLVDNHLLRFYLDEIDFKASQSLGLGIIKLVVEEKDKFEELGQLLIERAKEELTEFIYRERVISLIQNILKKRLANG